MKLVILLSFLALCRAQHLNFDGATGKLYSPNYPGNYDNNGDVVYTITIPVGNYIHLTFLDFLTEDSYDVLTIENSTTVSGDKTGFALDIQASQVTLVFTSDLTSTFRGFLIRYDSVPVGSVYMPTNLCSSILHNSEFDIITSPNFPYNYPDNISCAFLIKVSTDRLISFQFVAFNTEDGYDVVSVYDGANTSAPLIGHYSGKNMPAPITSTSNTLYLCFSSDLVTNFSGFSGLYTSFVSNNFKRGVLPQSLTTDSVAIRRDKNILDWLKKKAEEKKLIGAAAAPVISI